MSSRITAHTPVRTTRRRARALAISAAGLAVAFALSACSGSTLPAATGGATEGAGAPASDYDAIIASAPKADEATIADSEWATRIKEAGVLKTGGSDSGPLWSLKDPATGKIEGFDAGLSQMLAQYILGEPKTDLTITTVDTRETLLQNNTVDTVFATYSITPQRAEKIDFAGPYYMSGTSIQVKSDTTEAPKLSSSVSIRFGIGFIAPLGRSFSDRYMLSGEVKMWRSIVVGRITRKATKLKMCAIHMAWYQPVIVSRFSTRPESG